jgi:hypothetical protein
MPHSAKLSKLLIILSILFVIVIISVTVIVLTKDKPVEENTIIDDGQTVVVNISTNYDLNTYQDILTTYNAKDFQKTLDSSVKFATNSGNPLDQRLIAYDICIEVALELNNNDSARSCHEQAVVLTNELDNEEIKLDWQAILLSSLSGVKQDQPEGFEQDELR